MVGKLTKFSTTFIQTTFPDSVVKLLKNGYNRNCSQIPDCAENFNLKQRYLTKQIRYGGDSRGIGKMLKSSCSHKNFKIFGRVDFNWH